jgi:hypothetical protein
MLVLSRQVGESIVIDSRIRVKVLVVTATLAVAPLRGATLHVSLDSPDPTPPYTNWSTAAHVIQDAVDAAQPNDVVLVTNGVYKMGATLLPPTYSRVEVDKPLTLQSVNGPAVTIIEGDRATGASTPNGNGFYATRCVLMTNDVVLSGFTLTNGHTLADGDAFFRSGSGGGVLAGPGSVVTNCWFIGNNAWKGGGIDGGMLFNCTLTSNSAGDGWGGYYGGGAHGSVLSNCTLIGNTAGYGGGARGCTLYHCSLLGNHAIYGGGGVEGDGLSGASSLYDCVLRENYSDIRGGGATFSSLHNCTLVSNSATDRGGGAEDSELHNCLLTGNSAFRAGGAMASTLTNCTVVGNSATYLYGGVAWGQSINCIVYDNTAPDGANYAAGSPLQFSCTFPMPDGGLGNITNAPAFVDAAAGDFRLRWDSPCIDAGTNLTDVITNDLAGLPRPLDGNNDGVATFDMGAYEFNPYRFEPTLQLSRDGFEFVVRGEPGRTVRIERSRNLVEWELVATVPIPFSGQTLIDPIATTEPDLFYRASRMP